MPDRRGDLSSAHTPRILAAQAGGSQGNRRLEPTVLKAVASFSVVLLGSFMQSPIWCRAVSILAFAVAWLALLQGAGFAQVVSGNSSAAEKYKAGLLAIRSGDMGKAQSELEQAEKLDPKDADVQLALGTVLLHRGQVESAVPHLQVAAKLNPKAAAPHFYLGQAMSLQGHVDDAVREFTEASRLAPKDAETRRALAHALSAQGNLAEALVQAREAVALAPKSPEALDELGSLLAQGPTVPGAGTQVPPAP